MQVHIRKINIKSLTISRAILMDLKEVLYKIMYHLLNEPQCEKTNFGGVIINKVQTSLRIRAV